ncbi:hypothetical protein EYC84_009139 [Monilinia fructicola]|uniref:TPR-like protein n=1 Tax=Monilinia fructicola TaxID=38448 RepID=A0A5M9JE22_MONFR|nr:hypothetical protein EYC84_009139 [Monilinia fructicola]
MHLKSFTALLGTALVFYQSPKNHPEAKALFDGLLKENPTSTPALIGIGLIYEEEDDFPAAIDFLERALQRDPTNLRVKAEAAWVKAINGDYLRGREELEECLTQIEARDLKSRDLLAQTQYRVGVCLWNIDTSKSARKDRNGAYSYFLASLKSNLNFCPSIYESRANGTWFESVAQRVVNSGKVRPAPGSKKKGISWPFAALGTAELNKQDYSKSIVSFQSALRITPSDYHSWVGLGESYHNSGRYIAATKAFHHAEQFESETEQRQDGEIWFAKHMLANVLRELGDFDDAIDGAWDGIEKGLFGQAAQRAAEAIEVASQVSESRSDAFNLWRAVGDACAIYSWVRSHISEFPHISIRKLLEEGTSTYDIFADVDGVSVDVVFAKGLYPADEQEGLELFMLHLTITHAQAVAYYNLGWIEYRAHVCLSPSLKKKSTRYQKAAVRCFKRAIELEAGNSEFWNALGVVTSELNPKVAQHSFVRSLYLNERSAQTWTNLGTLYLLQNDFQLANDAFTRAQSTDPDYSHAWIGQGILALMMGDVKEANLLFTHAMEISGSSLITHRQYSRSAFDQILASKNISNVSDLVQPLFALNQVQSMAPDDIISKHLSSLFFEPEADYEVTESPESLSRFALAKADLARSQLANHEYEEAVESGDLTLQLCAEDSGQ